MYAPAIAARAEFLALFSLLLLLLVLLLLLMLSLVIADTITDAWGIDAVLSSLEKQAGMNSAAHAEN